MNRIWDIVENRKGIILCSANSPSNDWELHKTKKQFTYFSVVFLYFFIFNVVDVFFFFFFSSPAVRFQFFLTFKCTFAYVNCIEKPILLHRFVFIFSGPLCIRIFAVYSVFVVGFSGKPIQAKLRCWCEHGRKKNLISLSNKQPRYMHHHIHMDGWCHVHLNDRRIHSTTQRFCKQNCAFDDDCVYSKHTLFSVCLSWYMSFVEQFFFSYSVIVNYPSKWISMCHFCTSAWRNSREIDYLIHK